MKWPVRKLCQIAAEHPVYKPNVSGTSTICTENAG